MDSGDLKNQNDYPRWLHQVCVIDARNGRSGHRPPCRPWGELVGLNAESEKCQIPQARRVLGILIYEMSFWDSSAQKHWHAMGFDDRASRIERILTPRSAGAKMDASTCSCEYTSAAESNPAMGAAATSTFPCPSCGAERSSDRVACGDCGWPKKSTSMVVDDQSPSRRIQFHLRSLFAFVTVACIVFAAIGRFGIDGLAERLEAALLFAMPFAVLIEAYYRWIKDDISDT